MYNRCDDVLSRIKNGIFYNRKLKLYTKEYLIGIIKELQDSERYEDCSYLSRFLSKRFNYSDNYKSPIIW